MDTYPLYPRNAKGVTAAPSNVRAGPHESNLPGAVACALGAAIVLDAAWYFATVATGYDTGWAVVAVGVLIGMASAYGNDRVSSLSARYCAAGIALMAALVGQYLVYRQATILGYQHLGIGSHLPLDLGRRRTTAMFSARPGAPWWLLTLLAVAGAWFGPGWRAATADHR